MKHTKECLKDINEHKRCVQSWLDQFDNENAIDLTLLLFIEIIIARYYEGCKKMTSTGMPKKGIEDLINVYSKVLKEELIRVQNIITMDKNVSIQ